LQIKSQILSKTLKIYKNLVFYLTILFFVNRTIFKKFI